MKEHEKQKKMLFSKKKHERFSGIFEDFSIGFEQTLVLFSSKKTQKHHKFRIPA